MATLQEVWQEINYLLGVGLSVMPVRDKRQEYKGKIYEAKTPTIFSWKELQRKIIDPQELWHAMEKADTTAIAIICGQVSGNLEVLDIDVKEWPEIGGLALNAINAVYPELYKTLRIHQSPSGGYHILYRIAGGVPEGNKKIAYHAEKGEAGIESRGEGGYVLSPPSMGYKSIQHVPIPIITMGQRNAIWAICGSFNQRVKKDKHYATEYRPDEYYDENPFQHFNTSPAGESVLVEHGWKYEGKSGDFIHYTRPGKERGVSATFNRSNQLFYFFTTSVSGFDAGRCYTPSTVLSIVRFGGDRKACFRHLQENGYGKVKPHIEKRVIARNATAGLQVPANFSKKGLATYEELSKQAIERYPYGIFWQEEEGKMRISHERILIVSAGLGFRYHNIYGPILVDGYLLNKIDERTFLDTVKQYINEEDAEYQYKVLDAYERFMQASRKYIMERLPVVDNEQLLRSTKDTAYKFYSNCYLEITKTAVNVMMYNEIGGMIWADQVQPRAFRFIEVDEYVKSVYFDFLDKAIGISDHLLATIGYLSHEYKDSDGGYITVLTEQCPDPKQGGGSGKNLFTLLLGHTTTYKGVPGAQIQYNEKFLQAWNFERLFAVHDVPKRFDFAFLKELSTGGAILKKLWKDEIAVDGSLMPKFIISTNFSYEVSDGGLRRRIIPIEFTDFFTRCGGLRKYYGKMFPQDWDGAEWLAYDNIIMNSIQVWLQAGELDAGRLTAGGQLKQYEQEYGTATLEFLDDNTPDWFAAGQVFTADFNSRYAAFCDDNNIERRYRLGAKKLGDAVRIYAEGKGYKYFGNEQIKVNQLEVKKLKRFVKIL